MLSLFNRFIITHLRLLNKYDLLCLAYKIKILIVQFCFKTYKLLYGTCIVVWFLQILSPFSLTFVIQPFIEYGPGRIVPSVVIFLMLVSASLAVGYYSKVKYERI